MTLELRLHVYSRELKDSMRISRGGLTSRSHYILEVSEENGVSGFGEAIASAGLIENIFVSYDWSWLMKCRIEEAESKVIEKYSSIVYYEGLSTLRSIFCGLVQALEHLRSQVLAGIADDVISTRRRITPLQSYVSNVYWKDDCEEMNNDIKRLIDDGFTSVKAHIGVVCAEDELRRLDKISAISLCDRFMLDFNCGYSSDEAKKFAKLKDNSNHKYYWLEELTPPDDLKTIEELASQCGEVLAYGENHYGSQFDFLVKCGIKYIMPDLGRSIFPVELKNLALLAKGSSIITLHSYSSGVLLHHSIKAALSDDIFEDVELDLSDNALITAFIDGYQTVNEFPQDLREYCGKLNLAFAVPGDWSLHSMGANEK